MADCNGACSNCVYTGSDRFCHWGKLGYHGAVGEEDHTAVDMDHAMNAPPKPSSPFVPPRTQCAGRKRSSPDSDSDPDPDNVPPKRRKAGKSDDMHDYVPPKTRNAGSRSTESDADAAPYEVIGLAGDDNHITGSYTDYIGLKLSAFIDLTGEDDG